MTSSVGMISQQTSTYCTLSSYASRRIQSVAMLHSFCVFPRPSPLSAYDVLRSVPTNTATTVFCTYNHHLCCGVDISTVPFTRQHEQAFLQKQHRKTSFAGWPTETTIGCDEEAKSATTRHRRISGTTITYLR